MIHMDQIDHLRLMTDFVQGVVAATRSGKDPTAAVKSTLLQLALKGHFYPVPNPAKGIEEPEFLFDFVWYKNSDLNDMVLVAESERDRKVREVLSDFSKLMHSKAPIKLLAFWVYSKDRRGEVVQEIEKCYMNKFNQHVAREKYLLVGFFDEDQVADCYFYEVPDVANPTHVKFAQLASIPYPLA